MYANFTLPCHLPNMWQSRVEIERYSIVYFDRVTAFKALYCQIFGKGGTHTCYVDLSGIRASLLCYEPCPSWKSCATVPGTATYGFCEHSLEAQCSNELKLTVHEVVLLSFFILALLCMYWCVHTHTHTHTHTPYSGNGDGFFSSEFQSTLAGNELYDLRVPECMSVHVCQGHMCSYMHRKSGNYHCKSIFVVCVNHENNKHEISFSTKINHYAQHILRTRFHNTVSCTCSCFV